MFWFSLTMVNTPHVNCPYIQLLLSSCKTPMFVPHIVSKKLPIPTIGSRTSTLVLSSGIATILYIKCIQYTPIFGHTMACTSRSHIEICAVKYTKTAREYMFSIAQYKSLLFLQKYSPDL